MKQHVTSYFRWRASKLRRRIVRKTCSILYKDTNRDVNRSILIAGTGRSGTTWLADIIASPIIPCRVMFEPYHSDKVSEFNSYHYFHYLRPEDDDPQLQSFCQKIFSGAIRHPWIDRQIEHLRPEYRLVKEIRANLFLRWIHDRFPEVPLLFIIRHPCAVVLSRMNLKWATDSDIEPFLAQPALIEDFLSDKMNMIKRAKTPEEKHALIWCISNLVPLHQFRSHPLHIVFYEHLCEQPEVELPKIFNTIGHSFNDSAVDRVSRPSTTAMRTSAVVTGRDKISHWREKLASKQIDNILSVVEQFGLGYLYDDSLRPVAKPDLFNI